MSDLVFGLQITVVGMGLVFALLALLWGLLAIAGRFEPRPLAVTEVPAAAATQDAATTGLVAAVATPTVSVRGPGADQLEPEALAAIAAAVLAHAADRRRQAAPETRSYAPGSLLFASRWVAAGRARQTHGYQRERK